jgi:uncharacterized membrane protein YciS (DUF1049 family)
MMKAFLKLLILLPVAAIVLAFSEANRESVSVSFDLLLTQAPELSISAPMFVVLFAMVMLGILIGGVAAWFSQARLRRDVRRLQLEADRLRAQTDRRTGDAVGGSGGALAVLSGTRAA